MIPVKKEWSNIIMGQGQEGVLPCHAHRDQDNGDITIVFSLTADEIEAITERKEVYLSIAAGKNLMQPVLPFAVGADNLPVSDPRIDIQG